MSLYFVLYFLHIPECVIWCLGAAGFGIHCRPGAEGGGYGSESPQPAAGAAVERVYFLEFVCTLFWGTYLPEIAICGYVDNVYRVQLVLLYMLRHDLK